MKKRKIDSVICGVAYLKGLWDRPERTGILIGGIHVRRVKFDYLFICLFLQTRFLCVALAVLKLVL
ncbi:hypothetical protein ACRRTK_015440 [Alexandromys fortis]